MTETFIEDFNGDGWADTIEVDHQADGSLLVLVDTNADGYADVAAYDADADGIAEELVYDTNFDGVVDEAYTNETYAWGFAPV